MCYTATMRPTPRCANSMGFVTRAVRCAAPQPARPCFHVLRNAALIKWNAYLWSHCTGCTRYTGVRGARERGGKSGERERRGEKASAAAPSTCLAAPSGVTNLNGTLCAPIASACLLILTPHDFYRRRCRMLRCPPLITIAVKFGRG